MFIFERERTKDAFLLGGSVWSPQLSRPMQRKLLNLLCCNLVEPEGRSRSLKAVRSLGERSLTELLLMHQNPYHLSSNLWATVRARGCQFLGPGIVLFQTFLYVCYFKIFDF